jgi:glycosyltransferase involved in cell wall biosynthesis
LRIETTRQGGPRPGAGAAIQSVASVIVPVRNGARHLRTTLPALRSELPEGWELVVVDDHSDDDSRAVAHLYADRVLKSAAVRSAPAARNTGALASSGRILVFMDADVRVTRDALQRLVEGLDDSGVVLTFAMYSEGRHLRTLGGRFKNVWVRWSYLGRPASARWMNTALAAIRRDDFLGVGGYDASDDWLEGGNDMDFGRLVAERVGTVRLRHDIDCDHLKEMSLAGLLRNDFHRTRGFFRTALHSGEIRRVPRSSGYGNIPLGFMLGVLGAGAVPTGLFLGGLGVGAGWGVAVGGTVVHLLSALPFLAYALPRLGAWAPLAPFVYLLDQVACAAGLVAESAALLGQRLRPGRLPFPAGDTSASS